MNNETIPMSFDRFLNLYYTHLGTADRPSCLIAYCRAEADVVRETGERRYANYSTFKNLLCRYHRRRTRLSVQNIL